MKGKELAIAVFCAALAGLGIGYREPAFLHRLIIANRKQPGAGGVERDRLDRARLQ